MDCFYVGENMLVIHPDECIDCGVCEPECPAEAIVPGQRRPRGRLDRAQSRLRRAMAQYHPQGRAAADAEDWKGKPGKEALFSPEPGE